MLDLVLQAIRAQIQNAEVQHRLVARVRVQSRKYNARDHEPPLHSMQHGRAIDNHV
jgi:hypothetical protein